MKLYIFCYDSAENDEIHDDIDEYRTHVNIDKNIVIEEIVLMMILLKIE